MEGPDQSYPEPKCSTVNVLVVDDNIPFREWVCQVLRGGYTTYTAESCVTTCATLRQIPVAAVLLDAVLPDCDGLGLIPTIRTLSEAPIIVMTGHSTEDMAISALNHRADAYLRKPMTVARLMDVVSHLAPVDPIERARIFLDSHWDLDLSASELAERVGIAESTLRERFAATYGTTPVRYMTERRMRVAENLLRGSTCDVGEVGRRAGYVSADRFRRIFTRYYGVPPSEFRHVQPDRRENDG